MLKKMLLLVLALLCAPLMASAQQIVILDLAVYGGGSDYQPSVNFDKGTAIVEFNLTNALPVDYTITTKRTMITVAPLTLPQEAGAITLNAADASMVSFCRNTQEGVQQTLERLENETEIAPAREELLDAVQTALDDSTLSPFDRVTLQGCREEIRDAFDTQTTKHLGVFTLYEDETFTLTITRDAGNNKTVTRTITVPGTTSGEWVPMYGFGFFHNQDHSYFTEPVEGEESKFTIKEKVDREDADLALLLAYAWHGKSRHGFVGGLGVDLKEPLVFAGYQYTFERNIGLFLGGGVHRRTVLNGKYEKGDPIGTNLEGDQLIEKTYTPIVLGGISFRFDRSPFASGNKEESKKTDTSKGEKDQKKKQPSDTSTGDTTNSPDSGGGASTQ